MLAPHHLDALLAPYGLDPGQAVFLRRSQNLVYSHPASAPQRILRVTNGRHRTRVQIEAELTWLSFLAGQGILVCAPIPAANGERCTAQTLDGQDYLVTCFEHAPGGPVRPEHLDPALHENLGALVGRMHTAAVAFGSDAPALARPAWHESRLLREDFAAQHAHLTGAFLASVADLIRRLRTLPVTPQNHGLIHADVSFGNCFLHEGTLRIFDFDNCEHGYFFQDLATVLYDSIYCRVLNKFADAGLTARMAPRWAAVLAGYARTGPLTAISRATLRDFFLLREATIYVHYLRTLDPSRLDASFRAGMEVMRQNVETQTHQVDFDALPVLEAASRA